MRPRHINSYTPKERRQLMVAKLRAIVGAKGGTFDESAYENKRTPLQFRCSLGHAWTVQPQTVLTGSWCSECWKVNDAGKHLRKDGLSEARKIGAARGGQCLSNLYENNQQSLRWRCSNGHEWLAALSDVRRGTWCPTCGSGFRERLCRHYFEMLTDHRFPKTKPKWLLNDLGNRMELDGYCEDLKLAFEHQGEQHYRAIEHFNRREETLSRRQRDDKTKRQLCEQHGISLIDVPFGVQAPELGSWIRRAIRSARPDIAVSDYVASVDYVASNELNELRALARKRGGECLSPVYLGVAEKHRFSCAQGHEWEALASSVKQRTSCPVCKLRTLADKRRIHSVESLQELAKSRGGLFLSDTFNSVNDVYRWRCTKGHEWKTTPSEVFKGTWCRACHIDSRRGSIEEARQIARARGGECLSAEYGTTYTKLRWRCADGHEWKPARGTSRTADPGARYARGVALATSVFFDNGDNAPTGSREEVRR